MQVKNVWLLTVLVSQVKAEVCRNKIAMTPQRYNKLLRARSCTQATVNRKRVWQRLLCVSQEDEETQIRRLW